MPRLSSNIISVLDIGSSKTVCLIAKCATEENIEVLGYGHQFSEGVKSGIITDIELAEESVRAAVASAEEISGINIESVVVNISGDKIKCHNFESSIDVNGNEITQKEIRRLVVKAPDEFEVKDREIIHCFPIEYEVDGTNNIQNPVGMYCKKLKVKLNIVTVQRSIIININKCLAKCHLNIEGFIASSYASAIACMSKDEAKLGATIVDFGSSTTSISVIKNNNLTYIDTIPYGGIHITNDIAIGLSTTPEIAERTKNLHGNVFKAEKDIREIIELSKPNDDSFEIKQIPKSDLINIIKPRSEEIVEMVVKSLQNIGIQNIGNKIIITGGASELRGLDEMVEQQIDKPTKIGYPVKINGLSDKEQKGSLSTCTGMLIICAKKINSKFNIEDSIINRGIFKKIINLFKRIF